MYTFSSRCCLFPFNARLKETSQESMGSLCRPVYDLGISLIKSMEFQGPQIAPKNVGNYHYVFFTSTLYRPIADWFRWLIERNRSAFTDLTPTFFAGQPTAATDHPIARRGNWKFVMCGQPPAEQAHNYPLNTVCDLKSSPQNRAIYILLNSSHILTIYP
jgi:hypothetical protein